MMWGNAWRMFKRCLRREGYGQHSWHVDVGGMCAFYHGGGHGPSFASAYAAWVLCSLNKASSTEILLNQRAPATQGDCMKSSVTSRKNAESVVLL